MALRVPELISGRIIVYNDTYVGNESGMQGTFTGPAYDKIAALNWNWGSYGALSECSLEVYFTVTNAADVYLAMRVAASPDEEPYMVPPTFVRGWWVASIAFPTVGWPAPYIALIHTSSEGTTGSVQVTSGYPAATLTLWNSGGQAYRMAPYIRPTLYVSTGTVTVEGWWMAGVLE